MAEQLEWLTNRFDPRLEEAKIYQASEAGGEFGQSWEQYQKWLADKFIGDPKGNQYWTVQQLKRMSLVGIYRRKRG